MLRRATILGVVALAASAAPASAAHRADGRLSDWRGKATNVSGQTTTSKGEFIYTDWLYDDHGPNLDGQSGQTQYRSALAPVLGDYQYPAGAKYSYDAADLREVRVAADKRGLHFLI
jgi:hypothetical protein